MKGNHSKDEHTIPVPPLERSQEPSWLILHKLLLLFFSILDEYDHRNAKSFAIFLSLAGALAYIKACPMSCENFWVFGCWGNSPWNNSWSNFRKVYSAAVRMSYPVPLHFCMICISQSICIILCLIQQKLFPGTHKKEKIGKLGSQNRFELKKAENARRTFFKFTKWLSILGSIPVWTDTTCEKIDASERPICHLNVIISTILKWQIKNYWWFYTKKITAYGNLVQDSFGILAAKNRLK